MRERRRHQRYGVRWPVCLWLSETCFVTGHLVDVGPYGVRVKFSDSRLLSLMKQGKPFRLQVILGDTEGEFTRTGEVRHIAPSGIGLEVKDGLPRQVFNNGSGPEVEEELPIADACIGAPVLPGRSDAPELPRSLEDQKLATG